ncbi:hypothetical protein [Clostridium estertheticum]|nr:hypothetical protein [Clostridium estertheticum]MCB2356695.1 hypothetical protein [Clostridium estertheticum]WAG42777.1 hypothetical protein LL065_08940 [Clostridium estertheticum]
MNGEIGIFDVNPYLSIGIFQELKDWSEHRWLHN